MPSCSKLCTIDRNKYPMHVSKPHKLKPSGSNKIKPYYAELRKVKRLLGIFKYLHPKTVVIKIDTGATNVCLSAKTADAWDIDRRYNSKDLQVFQQPDGSLVHGIIRYVNLDLYGITLKNVPVVVPPAPKSQNEINKIKEDLYTKSLANAVQSNNRMIQNIEKPIKRDLLGTTGILDQIILGVDSEKLYLFYSK